MVEPLAVAYNGVFTRGGGFAPGGNVVVFGAGPIGLSAIQFLKAGGANKISALGTSPSKYPTLKEYGADYCLNPKELGDKLGDEIKKICGNPVGADIVFECAGNMNSLGNCINYCVKPGGQVVVIGTIQEPMSNLVPGSFSIHEPDLKFTFVYTADEVRIYLEMLAAGKIHFPGMVTDIIPLTDCVEKALDRKDRTGMLKILIDPSL